MAPLGAGGMGEVYRARDTRLDRTVAIKVLPESHAASPEARARFEREARAISQLQHPHVCTLFDVGRDGGRDYLVMEYLEGESLAARLVRGPLPLAEALRVGSQVARALAAAHRQGIVHRDLKPGNVFLTKGGAKLLDFGLAQHAGAAGSDLTGTATLAEPLTAQGSLLGTVPYMAPEQLEGKPADARSDLFAFGAVLYEMVTGRRAFQGESQASLIAAILDRQPTPMSAQQPLAPPALERLVTRCLAKDPDERWQSAQDVAAQLEGISQASAPEPTPATVGASARDKVRAVLPWILAAAALGAMALALQRRPEPASRQPVRFFLDAPEGSAFNFAGRDAGPVAFSPDGAALAYAATTADGKKRLFVRRLEELDARPLPGTEGGSYPFWSPDSRFLGFFAEGRLKKMAAEGGPVQVLCDAPLGRGGTWNRDGVIVFSPSSESPLHRVSASGGATTQLTQLEPGSPQGSHRWPSFLPDGRHFVYLRFSFLLSGPGSGHMLHLGSLDAAESRPLFQAASKAEYAAPGYLIFLRGGTLLAAPFDAATPKLAGEPRPLAERVQSYPNTASAVFTASATGALAYQTGAVPATSQLVWFDRQGTELGRLGPQAEWEDPSIAPDDRRVASQRLDPQSGISNIWLMQVDGGAPTRFTFTPTFEHAAVWAPDGSRIAFDSFRRTPLGVYQKALNGAEDDRPLVHLPHFTSPTDWSRDGRLLMVQTLHPETKWDLWTAPTTGEPQPYLRTDFNEMGARFSPDGRWVAYTSDESGSWEVYVAAFPGPGVKWQVSSAGGSQGNWRGDGRELFYLAADRKLMAVDVTPGDGFAVGAPRALFATRARYTGNWAYDATADGQRFIISTVVIEEQPTPLTIVLEGLPELEP